MSFLQNYRRAANGRLIANFKDGNSENIPVLDSGLFTPPVPIELSNVTVNASANGAWTYLRINNIVTVSGRWRIAVTGSGNARCDIELPFPRNTSGEEGLAGVGAYAGGITADDQWICVGSTLHAETLRLVMNAAAAISEDSVYVHYTYNIDN